VTIQTLEPIVQRGRAWSRCTRSSHSVFCFTDQLCWVHWFWCRLKAVGCACCETNSLPMSCPCDLTVQHVLQHYPLVAEPLAWTNHALNRIFETFYGAACPAFCRVVACGLSPVLDIIYSTIVQAVPYKCRSYLLIPSASIVLVLY